MDTNKDGELSLDELSQATGNDKTVLSAQIEKIDLDNSGTISFIEFLYSIFKTKGESELRKGENNRIYITQRLV